MKLFIINFIKPLSLIVSSFLILFFSINAQEKPINPKIIATSDYYKNKPIAKYESWGINEDIKRLAEYLEIKKKKRLENDKSFIDKLQKLQLENAKLLFELKNNNETKKF